MLEKLQSMRLGDTGWVVGVNMATGNILEFNPEWAYYSSAPFQEGKGFSPMQNQYWRGQYGDVWDEYLGSLGAAEKRGQDAPLWTSFLEDMPWTQRYTALGPSLRPGGSTRQYSPSVRYAYT